MIDILSYWKQGRKTKTTPSGWISGNAPCCVHNGNTADKKSRGGIKQTDQGWSYHCFNCLYTASFIPGHNLSLKTRKLLGWLGVSERDIEMLNLESMRHRSIYGILDDRRVMWNQLADIKFQEQDLPPAAELLPVDDSECRTYVQSRCVPDDFPVMIQSDGDKTQRGRSHVIIPFTYNNSVVGHTCRFLDGRSPKYITNSQPGYVFGIDLQKDNWEHAIVVEGTFDALSISGLAVLHNTINDEQARLIRTLGKSVTVVPDRDKSGVNLIDRAIELGWAVSIPEWPAGCKDVNDAVIKLGRVGTMLTIFAARETSKIKIEIRKRQLVRKIC